MLLKYFSYLEHTWAEAALFLKKNRAEFFLSFCIFEKMQNEQLKSAASEGFAAKKCVLNSFLNLSVTHLKRTNATGPKV